MGRDCATWGPNGRRALGMTEIHVFGRGECCLPLVIDSHARWRQHLRRSRPRSLRPAGLPPSAKRAPIIRDPDGTAGLGQPAVAVQIVTQRKGVRAQLDNDVSLA